MKVIFLDIDGVLVNRKSLEKAGGMRATADPACVEALNAITDATGAYIVVSSTWRYYNKQMGYETPAEFMRAKLAEWGVRGVVIGCTPDLSRQAGTLYAGVERGDEIQAWLDGHAKTFAPVDSFIILDDDPDMKHLQDRLIKTEMQYGLLINDAERAQRMLGVDTIGIIAETNAALKVLTA